MRKIKIRAGLYLAATALYVWFSALLMEMEIRLPAGLALIVGLLCGRACMQCGVDIERWRRVRQAVKEKELKATATENKWVRCEKCGCSEFRLIAGREVCICCGEVMRSVQR